MARGDIVQIPQIQGPVTPFKINRELWRLWQRVFAWEGRTDASQIRDDLSVAGTVTAENLAVANAVLIGNLPLSTANLSQDPEIEFAPAELLTTSPLGAILPRETLSPFSFAERDEFFGQGTASGSVGDLGWAIVGSTVSSGGTALGHPGIISLNIAAGPAVGQATLRACNVDDIQYLAAVVSPSSSVDEVNLAFGVTSTNPAAGVEVVSGIYWSYVVGTSPNWRTVTNDGGSITTNTTSVEVIADDWYLLEIVINSGAEVPYADFYINRQRAFRHITDVITNSTATPIFIVQPTAAPAKAILIDRFLMSGSTPLSLKIYS